jgi:hypothetical protein
MIDLKQVAEMAKQDADTRRMCQKSSKTVLRAAFENSPKPPSHWPKG